MRSIYFALILAVLLPSCAYRYQVFDIHSEEVISEDGDYFIYENNDIEIYYDYWAEGGYPVFKIHNRTDSVMYLNLQKSAFKVNGVAVDYYNPSWSGSDYEQLQPIPLPPVVKIQPHKGYQLQGYPISWRWERIKNKPGYITFDESKSPFRFANELTYSFEQDLDKAKVVENEFWIGKIEKMKRKEFKEFKTRESIVSNKFYVYKPNETGVEFWADFTLTVLEAIFFL